MRSSTPDAPPGQVPASKVTADVPAAGTARPTTLRVKLADLALRVPWRRLSRSRPPRSRAPGCTRRQSRPPSSSDSGPWLTPSAAAAPAT